MWTSSGLLLLVFFFKLISRKAIGFNSIINISTKLVNSKLKGTTQALYILASSNNAKFEFIFTNLVPGNMRHFTSVMGVHKSYMSSKLYRQLKLRGAVVLNKQLKILPLEQVFTTLGGVWNLSTDQGCLGTLIVSNVRLVWFADVNEGFNISLPHLQIESINIRESKFGMALVVSSTEESGAYVLGFRIDPEEKLRNTYKELISLHTVYTNNPIYGVEYSFIKSKKEEHYDNSQSLIDESEIEEPKGEMTNELATYSTGEDLHGKWPPEYSGSLGLAVESVKEGSTLKSLWEVIPS